MKRICILTFFCLLWSGFSVLAQEDLVGGLVWNDEEYNQQPLKIGYDLAAVGLPPAHSLKHYCPPVINQGSTNTSVAWAVAWYGRTLVQAVTCGRKEHSYLESYNAFFNHRLLVDDCTKPVSLTAMLKSIQQDGALKFREYKEVCPDTILPEISEAAKTHRLSGYTRLFQTFDSRDIKVNAIRAALAANNPVVVGSINTTSLEEAKEVWQITEQRTRKNAGQALCIIGYDDSKWGGAFEVVGSHGKSWGKHGFTWVKYDDVADVFQYGFELFDTQYGQCLVKTLEAQVKFIKTGGEVMEGTPSGFGSYALKQPYPNKTEFKIQITTTGRMFAYGLFADPSYNMFAFLPMEGQAVSNAFSEAKQNVMLPFGNFPFTLEPPTGTNQFVFVFSAVPLDVDQLSRTISRTPGDITQKVAELSTGRNIPKSIAWSNDLKFTATPERDFFAVMTVRMEQVD